MDAAYETTTVVTVFPWVTFTCSRQDKTFCIPRESVIHAEDYQEKDGNGVMQVDTDRTYVIFKNPNPTKGSTLHAVVDMPVNVFRETVLRKAYVPSA